VLASMAVIVVRSGERRMGERCCERAATASLVYQIARAASIRREPASLRLTNSAEEERLMFKPDEDIKESHIWLIIDKVANS
jgi:hypothetical protein